MIFILTKKFFNVLSVVRFQTIFIIFFILYNFNYQLKSENLINYEILSYEYDELYSKIEFNYYFLNKLIDYQITTNDSLSGNVNFSLKLTPKDSSYSPIIDNWTYSSKIHKSEFKKEISLFGNRYIGILPNKYIVNLKIQNPKDSTILQNIDFEAEIPNYYQKFTISDLQIAYIIENEKFKTQNWSDVFFKNSLFVIPNPICEINSNNPKLYLYYEIYNAKSKSPDGLEITYTVLDAAKREVSNYKKNKNSYGDAMVEYLEYPITNLSTGVYYINVKINKTNTDNNQLVIEKTKKFYLINPDLPPDISINFSESLTFEESAFSSYDEERINEEFDKISYILDQNEKDEFKLLTDYKAKQRAIFKYWTLRDPKPETKVNEKMIEYDKRISFADTYFKQGSLSGWRTERGRTLLKYGFPTQRNIYPQRDTKVAAEEWFYSEIRGGVYFYFVDRLMNNTFILAHSTMPNEVFNEYWYTDYNPAIESDGSLRFKQDDRNQIRK